MNRPTSAGMIRLRDCTFFLGLSVAAAGAAQAQGQASAAMTAGQDVNDEIVVTANKRGAETLSNIAASVQAIGEKAIKQNALVGFDDYARQASNLTSLNKGPGQTQIAFRGIVASRVNFGQPQAQSTTGFYFDDVPLTSAAFNPDLGLVDIQRIEVLRGPQGTLYGSSAMSGALRVIPNMPNTDRFEGNVGGLVSNTKDGGWNHQINATLNVPLGDRIAVRGTAYNLQRSGFIDNIYSGEKNYNDDRSYGGRLLLTLKPVDDLTITGMFIYNHLKANGRPDEYRAGDPDIAQAGFFSGNPRSLVGANEDPAQFNVTRGLQTVKPIDELFKDEVKVYSLKAEYTFEPFNAALIGSHLDRKFQLVIDDYRRIRDIFGPDNIATGQPFSAGLFNETSDRRSTVEARLSSNSASRIKWVIGGYYEKYKRDFALSAPIADLDQLLTTIGALPAGQTSATFYGTPVPNVLFSGSDNIDGSQKSVFGELTIPVPFVPDDKLSITLGGRYYDYSQTAQKISSGFVIGPAPTNATFAIKENGFNPKAAIEYRHSRDLLAYASVAKGFRIGGTNERLPDPSTTIGQRCVAELAALGISGSTDTYGSDSLTSYELGTKTSWMDNKVKLNAALFLINWKNIQTNVFLQCGFSIVANESSQKSKGAEIELSARVSNSLTLDLSGSYTHAALSKDSQTLAARKGDRAPYVPKWNLTAGFQYRSPEENAFGTGGRFYLNGDISYVGSSFSEYAVSASVRRLQLPSSIVGNAAFGLDMGRWNVGLFIKNIWNERIVTAIDTDRNTPAAYTRGRPRTVGLNTSLDF